MPNIMFDLEVDRVDLVDEGANSAAHIKLYKRKEHNTMNLEEILAKMKPEHMEVVKTEIAKSKTASDELTGVKEELSKAKEDLAKAKEDLGTATATVKAELTQEEVIKSLDPAVQEVFKSLSAQKDAAEEVVKSLNAANLEKEAVAKAKELKAIPVDEATLVAVAKSASPEIFEVLKAASNAIGTDVLGEVGKSADNSKFNTNSSADTWDKIEKMAGELVSETVTKQKAITMVIKQNPKMYAEYVKGGN